MSQKKSYVTIYLLKIKLPFTVALAVLVLG
jgi:hypothetical protein